MFRFVALFALVAVAFAEPEADPQYFYHHLGVPVVKPVVPVVKYTVPVVKPVVPVLKYVDPHHTEGMTKDGVPEKTDSVKIAEKQHEIAHTFEKAKKAVVPYAVPSYPYVHPYTYGTHYPYVHPYVHAYVPTVAAKTHVVEKREAEAEADPYYYYNTYAGVTHHPYVTGYPYTTAFTGYPYTAPVTVAGDKKAVEDKKAVVPYVVPSYPWYGTYGTHYPYAHPYVHSYVPTVAAKTHTVEKREAEGEADPYLLYNTYAGVTHYPYATGYTPYTYNHAYNYYPHNYGTYHYGR